MSQNSAAWITAPRAKPLEIKEAPLWKAGPGEVIVKNAAVAINPVEWKIQDSELLPMTYPNILGADVAGVVEEVGEGVTRLQKGQRVMAYATSIDTSDPSQGGFQLYTRCQETLVSPIPDTLSFEQAVVLPLAISTAAAGLYEKTMLNLPFPTVNGEKHGVGKTLLVWGAASSVGSAAVQLAAASGLRIVATASARNHEFVRALGASSVIDYGSPSVVEDVVAAVKESGEFVGVFDSISGGNTFELVGKVLDVLGTAKVAVVMPPPENLSKSVQPLMVLSFTIPKPPHEEVGDAVWRKYVPEALQRGLMQAKPDPLVVGTGLEKIQEAIDRQKAGVSAKKVVVLL
ncbi:Alcohol dehydrogenase superfamily zinc-containing [Lasiodiplodia theobromae]|uniref:Dehydrogenase orsE n=1 Tax=Lasiodiplodia theobromae TaxID=45133 RepID=A0A5N5DD25_9PEZI|nr:Dehydrogenase orsE [Lasiodiplodia theobromae]KAF9637436.1 Alcohol dehydrogenase superfamily zinc-containing [Lasiodiplodia theobromae]